MAFGFGALPPGFGPTPLGSGTGTRLSAIDPETGLPYPAPAPDPNEIVQRGLLLPVGQTRAGQTVPAGSQLGQAAWNLAASVPDAVPAAINGIGWVGDVARGRASIADPATGHVSDEAVGKAFDLAGMAATGGFVSPKPAGAIGMFGGRSAKTADLDALGRAESMAAKGADRQAIWDDTGWFQGADQKWRFEIPDDASRMTDKATAELTASGNYGAAQRTAPGVLHHDRLYAAYPETRQIDVDARYNANLKTPDASYGPPLWSGDRPQISMQLNALDGPAGPRSFMLHELQHGVQGAEGFAQGASPEVLAQQMPDVQAINDARVMSALVERGTPFEEAPSAFLNMMGRDSHPVARDLLQRNTTEQLHAMPSDPMEAYKRSAGEVEARNVETRRDFTPEERRAQPPWLTQDVPDEQQIVRFGQLGPQMSVPMDQASRMARAAQQGYTIPAYHGTNSDFGEFKRVDGGNARGAGYYFTESPETASAYATGENVNRITPEGNAGPNVMPVMLQAKKVFDESAMLSRQQINELQKAAVAEGQDWKRGELAKTFDYAYKPTATNVAQTLSYDPDVVNRILQRAGYDARKGGAMDRQGAIAGQSDIVVFDPSQIRSRFAAFDPKNKGSASILASLLGVAGAGAAMTMPDEDQAAPRPFGRLF